MKTIASIESSESSKTIFQHYAENRSGLFSQRTEERSAAHHLMIYMGLSPKNRFGKKMVIEKSLGQILPYKRNYARLAQPAPTLHNWF